LALDDAPQGSLVVIFPESVSQAIAIINQRNPIEDDAAQKRDPASGDYYAQIASSAAN
jgi:cyanophycin synthetase